MRAEINICQNPATRAACSPTQSALQLGLGRLEYGGVVMSAKCEFCGADMVKKTARRGPNAGGQFWGCSNWSRNGKHSSWSVEDEGGPQSRAAESGSAGTTDSKVKTPRRKANPVASELALRPEKVLWSDLADQRDDWESRYTSAGARLRALPVSMVEEVERDLGACWIAASDLDSHHPADTATQRVLAMARKIFQRGSLPFIDPRIEQELLEAAGIKVDEPQEGSLVPRLAKGQDLAFLRDHLHFARPGIVDSSLEFGSDEESALVDSLMSESRVGRFVSAQTPLEALATGLGNRQEGHRRLDFLFTHPEKTCVIEVDGIQHATNASDDDRDELMSSVQIPTFRIDAESAREGELPKELNNLGSLTVADAPHGLLHGPVQINRLIIALVEAVRRGFIAGDTWVIDLHDETDLALTGLQHNLNLLFAIDKLWGESFMPSLVQFHSDSAVRTWGRAGSLYEEIDEAPLAKDVDIYLDLGNGSLEELPDHDGFPTIVVRDAPLPIRVRDTYGEPTVRTVPSIPAHELDAPLETILSSVFALTEFRDGQLDAVKEVVQGRDCVVLLPTGAGKSLVYQMAGLVLPGRTLIVDPLVSLMEDQVRSLQSQGIDRVLSISGFTSQSGQTRDALRQVQSGDALFVFLSPERLQMTAFRESLLQLAASTPVNLAVIDEAHCVSEWGHDFRTAYLNVGKSLRKFGADSQQQPPPILALTGTASRAVLKDVLNDLDIEQRTAHTLIKPKTFDRPELRYEVRVAEPSGASSTLAGVMQSMPDYFDSNPANFFKANSKRSKAGLVFVPHTNGVNGVVAVADTLSDITGNEILRYSGGAPKGVDKASWERSKRDAARRFMSNEVPVMVTTKAFGMGIDKPDIRYVVHYGIPGSIESYYQEVGRAGRDRQPARCVLVVSELDAARTGRLLSDDTELMDLHEEVAKKKGPQNSDDIDRQLFFYTNSFKGEATEIAAVHQLLDELEPLDEAHVLTLGFGDRPEIVGEREKALHRLALLGVVSDYTKDYGSKSFEVTIAESTPDSVADSLVQFIERSQPGRSSGLRSKVTEASRGKTRDAVETGTKILTDFIYETIAAARRRSLREMMLAARENQGNEERFRQRILDYLQEGDVAPIIEALTDAKEFDLQPWITAVRDINTIDEANEWRGSTARLLASYPEQPGLLIGRGYSEMLLPDGDFEEALSNIHSGFRSALRSYNIDPATAFAGIEQLINDQIGKDAHGAALGLSFIVDELFEDKQSNEIRDRIKQDNPTMPALAVTELHKELQDLLETCDELFMKEMLQ